MNSNEASQATGAQDMAHAIDADCAARAHGCGEHRRVMNRIRAALPAVAPGQGEI
jgi:hypothetical protein